MKGLLILTGIAAAFILAALIFWLCGYTPAHLKGIS